MRELAPSEDRKSPAEISLMFVDGNITLNDMIAGLDALNLSPEAIEEITVLSIDQRNKQDRLFS